MKWFRFYADALNHPKVQTLDGELFKFWINILCVTSQCNGAIPSHVTNGDKIAVTYDEIAFYLRMPVAQVKEYFDELINRGLIDIGEQIKPHNWDKKQYKSDTSAKRTRKYRERKKSKSDENGDDKCDVTVTPPDTDTDTDKYIYISLLRAWEIYPATSKGSKSKAAEKFKALVIDDPPMAEKIVAAIENQVAEHKLKTRYGIWCPEWKHFVTWLNQRCWENEVNLNEEHWKNEAARSNKKPVSASRGPTAENYAAKKYEVPI